ncbi:MAG: tRNA (adenosine(37)-N6)-dimethylallyltransferase MiaA [Alteraurantiacibacter sp.]
MSKDRTPDCNQNAGKVALIAGPTASGKSDLAVRLALALQDVGRGTVVINADSAQVYADLRVLSARPSEEDMRGVEHRLFGAWDGAEACSAAEWAEAAKGEIARAHHAGAVPILVGGTGLYIRTLLDGIAPVPPIHEAIREAVRAMNPPQIYAALLEEDHGYALQLNCGDRQRTSRALEVVRSSGKSLKEWQKDKVGGVADAITLAPLVLLPEREPLYARCDARFAAMMDQGAPEEVEALLARQIDPLLPVMCAIGVREIAGYLHGSWSRAEAIAMGQQATRNYAKRQYTWLRHQPPADWPRLTPESVDLQREFETLFRN